MGAKRSTLYTIERPWTSSPAVWGTFFKFGLVVAIVAFLLGIWAANSGDIQKAIPCNTPKVVHSAK